MQIDSNVYLTEDEYDQLDRDFTKKFGITCASDLDSSLYYDAILDDRKEESSYQERHIWREGNYLIVSKSKLLPEVVAAAFTLFNSDVTNDQAKMHQNHFENLCNLIYGYGKWSYQGDWIEVRPL